MNAMAAEPSRKASHSNCDCEQSRQRSRRGRNSIISAYKSYTRIELTVNSVLFVRD